MTLNVNEDPFSQPFRQHCKVCTVTRGYTRFCAKPPQRPRPPPPELRAPPTNPGDGHEIFITISFRSGRFILSPKQRIRSWYGLDSSVAYESDILPHLLRLIRLNYAAMLSCYVHLFACNLAGLCDDQRPVVGDQRPCSEASMEAGFTGGRATGKHSNGGPPLSLQEPPGSKTFNLNDPTCRSKLNWLNPLSGAFKYC